MAYVLYQAPCYVAEDGLKTPGHDNGSEVVDDTTYQTPRNRVAYDSTADHFIVLISDSIVVPSSWQPRTREQIQEQYGGDSEYNLYPMPGWEA